MKKILIVDDEVSLRMLVGAALEGEDYRILQAHNGHEAIIVSLMQKPDLILLDLMMPGFSGLDVLETMKKTETTKNIPVIILTAKAQAEDRIKALELGAAYFITKPFSPHELLNLVNHLLKVK